MIRWMIVIFLALLLISWFTPMLRPSGATGTCRLPPPSCWACSPASSATWS